MLELATTNATDHEVRTLLQSGWGTLVSGVPGGPVISHLPFVLADEDPASRTVLAHLARTDADLHELGAHDVVLVVEGAEGYISPAFYQAGPYVPSWNFMVVHLHGRPELLDAEETYDVLSRTVDHFESVRPDPWRLASVEGYAQAIAPGTTGFRLTPSRVVGKAKLSQDKPPEVVRRVIAALESDDVHANPPLATAMRNHHLGPPPNSGA